MYSSIADRYFSQKNSTNMMSLSKKTMRAADEKLIINKLVDWYYHFHGFVRSAIFVTVDDLQYGRAPAAFLVFSLLQSIRRARYR